MHRFRRYWVVWHIIVSPKAGGSGTALSHFDSTLRRRAQLAFFEKRGGVDGLLACREAFWLADARILD